MELRGDKKYREKQGKERHSIWSTDHAGAVYISLDEGYAIRVTGVKRFGNGVAGQQPYGKTERLKGHGGVQTEIGMSLAKNIFGKITTRRTLALLAGLALFYFVAGGDILHEHKGTTPCHVCQALHLPALAPATLAAIAKPEFVSWHYSQPVHAAPSEAFSLYHAGRAPPIA